MGDLAAAGDVMLKNWQVGTRFALA